LIRWRSRRFLVVAMGFVIGASSLYYEFYQIVSVPESRVRDLNVIADCGVVLTGSAGRIREAFEILAQKRIKKLIISGVYKETQLIHLFPHLPYYNEINDDDVILEKKSESTYGNAVQSLALVNALKCREILLITSQLHMFRAHRIFQDVFPESVQIIPIAVSNRKDFTVFDYLLETVKSSFYWVLGLVV